MKNLSQRQATSVVEIYTKQLVINSYRREHYPMNLFNLILGIPIEFCVLGINPSSVCRIGGSGMEWMDYEEKSSLLILESLT